MNFFRRIKRKLMKLRMQPVRVLCFHHVTEEYDASYMKPCDWLQLFVFQADIERMRQDGVRFVSLSEAYRHISRDWFRCCKYVAITFDDGYASLKEILPWLEEQKIPVTLFINGKYLDGKSYRKNPKEKYLTHEELFAMTSPLIEIGSHGWEHTDASKMTESEFAESIDWNKRLLSTHPRYVPFHAYTWGRYTNASDKVLTDANMIPVLIDGMGNYNTNNVIHRE